ncbi:MAG: hypothetical protein ACYCZV_01405 [Acidimicrobiales bacterium]
MSPEHPAAVRHGRILALTLAGFLLLGGRAADLFGRRCIFVLDIRGGHPAAEPARTAVGAPTPLGVME